MTTTADKALLVSLAQTSLKLEGQMKHLEESLMLQKEDLDKLQQSIESADPEPLECWVALGEDGGVIGESGSRIEVAGRVRAVPVREVTPQDEQDRLKFRENTCNDALNYPPN